MTSASFISLGYCPRLRDSLQFFSRIAENLSGPGAADGDSSSIAIMMSSSLNAISHSPGVIIPSSGNNSVASWSAASFYWGNILSALYIRFEMCHNSMILWNIL